MSRRDIGIVRGQGGEGEPARTVDEFVSVMGRLKAVIEAENDHLSRGLPATLIQTFSLKGTLSENYARLSADMVEGERGRILSDPELRDKLIKASALLCAMTSENRRLLSDALQASRRRIDAIVDAAQAADHGSADQALDADGAAKPGERG